MADSHDQKNKIQIKIAIIGDTSVGKSTFINNFILSSGDKNVIQSNINKIL